MISLDASSDDDGEEDDPIMEHRWVSHPGAVNRIRVRDPPVLRDKAVHHLTPRSHDSTQSMAQKPGIVASWSELGLVHIWNLQKHVHALDTPGSTCL